MRYNVKMHVIPSIDVEKIEDLTAQLRRLTPFYNRFQIDYADGQYVNFLTPPLIDLLNSLSPYRELRFDLHLMTLDYRKALESIRKHENKSKLNTIFIHHGANPPPELFLDSSAPYNYGLVLNPADSVDAIKHIYDLQNIKNIQIMSVVPGPQGNPFLLDSLNKVDRLRDLDYRNFIFLDGGVNKESLEIIKKNKHLPDYICPGSFFSQAPNMENQIHYLTEALK